MLKRDSPLRTGNTGTFLKAINNNVDKIINELHFLMEENLFLRPITKYPELTETFEKLKVTKSHLRRK